MAWNTPPTFTAGDPLTAAQLNTISNNLLETAVAKATVASWPRHFVSTGANALAERLIRNANVDTGQNTSSTSYADLSTVGPQITIATGAFALVFINAQMENSTDAQLCYSSYGVYGTTSSPSEDERSIQVQSDAARSDRFGGSELQALTIGSNVFNMEYRVGGGTGTFSWRRMIVMAL